ncbi:undecaprenyl-phosphate glucose phosphotransferase [Brevibacillus brevis]|uniref:Undecaprenyl-phosphate glucose phosphotransferase n=1 Tax=Brevibacillus brevis TaxID=1393 RepID=A0A2Z4MSC7_BREBE|nr:undecaprenyl-phosphate glucose phosphotransferase [Brevibacillus brevis]AWX59331.1 undecaprenyl-phosphate glucose phosphotransferase [Brevibacillus brevis]
MIRDNQKFLSQIYAVFDLIFVQIAFLISWWLKFHIFATGEAHLTFGTYFLWAFVYGIIANIVGYIIGFYSPKRKKRFSYEAYKVIQVHIISFFGLISLLFVMKEIDFSRSYLLIFLSCNIVFVGLYRFIVKIGLKLFRKNGYNKQFILILGAGEIGRRFHQTVIQNPDLGFTVVGFLDDYRIEHDGENRHLSPILGGINELDIVLDEHLVDEVIIALPLRAHTKYGNIISVCEKAGVRTLIIPDFFDILPARPYIDTFADIPLINVRDIPLDELSNRMLKRLFDICFSLVAILLTLPLLFIIAIGIKMTSKGPVIFKQERVGMNRRSFEMYKFRSMKVMSQDTSDKQWTVENDPRKTRFGTFLRKTSLDELPQFFNVLKGDMSVVGPRPERPYFVEQFKEEVPKYMVKHHVRPGITGWAQANGLRGDTSIEDRILHDIFYIENWTLLFDIKIIYKTILRGFVNKNAY